MKNSNLVMLSQQMRNAILLAVLLFSYASFRCNSQETVSVGLLKMNVLYRAVDNPATIAVSGVAQADITVKFSNGICKMVGNNYMLNPTKLGVAVLSVSVKDREVGKVEFRVKDLPDPVAKVKGHKSGTVDKSWLAIVDKVTAELENSDFDYSFQVLEFTVSATVGNFNVEKVSKSDKFNSDQVELIKTVKSGEKVIIQDIKVLGPEGTPRSLEPLVFTVR